jgi:hypothetical protein
VNMVPYDLYPAWITLDKADSGMKAVPATAPPGSGLDLKAFQNLGYTGEWFVFAGFVVFMWFRLLRREVEYARDAELGLVPEGQGSAPEVGDGAVSGAPASGPGAGGGDAGAECEDAGALREGAAEGSEETVGGSVKATGDSRTRAAKA